MEAKKSKEANLENKRLGFFFIGLVMIGSFVGMAINFTQAYVDPYVEKITKNKFEEEVIFELQEEEEPEEIEPESAPPPPMIETIEIVPDDEEVPEIDFTLLDEEPEEIPDDTPEKIEEEPILDIAEVEPSFPGGPAAMAAWIQKEVKYPELASEMGEQGMVYVKFVVNKDGSIEQVSVRKGVSDALDKEAIRVVKAMPKWTPGEQAGKPVRVSFTLPISFKLG